MKNGEEMGRNDVSVFVCNASAWGYMGRKRVSPLEMGTEGRGRVSGVPTLRKETETPDSGNKTDEREQRVKIKF